jgi:hypothetical protein
MTLNSENRGIDTQTANPTPSAGTGIPPVPQPGQNIPPPPPQQGGTAPIAPPAATAPITPPAGNVPAPAANTPAGGSAPTAPAGPQSTNAVGSLKLASEIIVNSAPYKVNRCDQVVMFDAKRLAINDDYTSRAPAYFTMSAYLVNMFEAKDSNKLLESINLGHMRNIQMLLQGSKNCMLYQDSTNFRNITMCLNDDAMLASINEAYGQLARCRMGGSLKDLDPTTINKVLEASCNGFSSTTGATYDLPALRTKLKDELVKNGVNIIFNI